MRFTSDKKERVKVLFNGILEVAIAMILAFTVCFITTLFVKP